MNPGPSIPPSYLAAAVQVRATDDTARNLRTAEGLVREAAAHGAVLVALPEHFGYLVSEGRPSPHVQTLDGPWIDRFRLLAKELAITLVLGTISESIPGEERTHNTTVVLGPDGYRLGFYRKIHLFDSSLPEHEHLQESLTTRPGTSLCLLRTPLGALGLAICYDLRFAELFRSLTRSGAQVLLLPSAFTARTGPDHWDVLLRCRAIENLAYVIAPAQWGAHSAHRSSHGHSMIVDPWGRVLDCLPTGDGLVLARIDLAAQLETRRQLPCLDHIRLPLA